MDAPLATFQPKPRKDYTNAFIAENDPSFARILNLLAAHGRNSFGLNTKKSFNKQFKAQLRKLRPELDFKAEKADPERVFLDFAETLYKPAPPPDQHRRPATLEQGPTKADGGSADSVEILRLKELNQKLEKERSEYKLLLSVETDQNVKVDAEIKKAEAEIERLKKENAHMKQTTVVNSATEAEIKRLEEEIDRLKKASAAGSATEAEIKRLKEENARILKTIDDLKKNKTDTGANAQDNASKGDAVCPKCGEFVDYIQKLQKELALKKSEMDTMRNNCECGQHFDKDLQDARYAVSDKKTQIAKATAEILAYEQTLKFEGKHSHQVKMTPKESKGKITISSDARPLTHCRARTKL